LVVLVVIPPLDLGFGSVDAASGRDIGATARNLPVFLRPGGSRPTQSYIRDEYAAGGKDSFLTGTDPEDARLA
jgi:hypothetical protein